MLDDSLKSQLGGYLQRLQQDVHLIASLDDSEAAGQMRTLLSEITELSPRVIARFDGTAERRPSFQVTRAGDNMGVVFAAVPLGHEFTSLVLALLQAGGHPPKVEAEVVEQIKQLEGDFVFETWMSLTCHNCPDVVQAFNLMAVLNPRIKHVAIDGGLFQDEVEARQIMAVPAVFLNGQPFGSGRMELSEILAKVDTGVAARDAARLQKQEPFDVLVVGGGPAGAAAAVYAARKGIRTGLVAERFGGQTLDTMGIENFISVTETQGPKFAAALEAHVRAYDVEMMNGQRVEALEPAVQQGGYATVRLSNGAELKSRSVVLATGARWRNIGVPGEREYKNKGVAYCPHCDGPLFKGKKVAVIGGGNSGVEARVNSRPMRYWWPSCAACATWRCTSTRKRKRSRATATRSTACAIATARVVSSIRSTLPACSCRSGSCPTPSGSKARWRSTDLARSKSMRAARPTCTASSPPAMQRPCPTSKSSSPAAKARRLRCQRSIT
jgi:NADH-dependent peroxiredoxin subunit F